MMLPAVGEVTPLNVELFEAELSCHPDRVVRKDCETVSFHVNNEAVVRILNSWTSKDPNIMHLLRSLLKVAAYLSFTFAAVLFQEKLTA